MFDAAKEKAKAEPPERWSVQRKTEVVLRLLRGEDLLEVSREIQVPPPELQAWRRVFLESASKGSRAGGGTRRSGSWTGPARSWVS
jgi:hypothetical protein